MRELIAVSNASPIIFLAKIGGLELLRVVFSECLTTTQVKNEILRVKDAPEVPVIRAAFKSWLKVSNPVLEGALWDELSGLLHPGEASIIFLAARAIQKKNQEQIVILDDLTARDVAKSIGLEYTGTLGVILLAVEQGFISNVKARKYLDALVDQTSMYLSGQLYKRIRQELE